MAALVGAGFLDTWTRAELTEGPPGGVTNWTPGPRRGRAPTQRLDYVFIPSGLACDVIRVGGPDERGFDEWAELSDHLPVAAHLMRDPALKAG